VTLLRQMQRTIAAQRLFEAGAHLLVAASGGADSTALLLALHESADTLRLRISVAHLHHGLRGAEADADAAFVEDLAGRLGCRCVVGRADVARRARRSRLRRRLTWAAVILLIAALTVFAAVKWLLPALA